MVLRTAACEWRFLRTAFRGILTTGRLATAVRFGSRPAPPAGRHLTGPKGLQDVPYESGPVDRLLTATGGLRPANGVFSEQHFAGFPQRDA